MASSVVTNTQRQMHKPIITHDIFPVRTKSSPSTPTYAVLDGGAVDEEPKVLNHVSCFSLFMVFVIFTNSLVVGAELQWKPKHFPQLEPVYEASDLIFTIIYTIEVVLLIKEHGRHFLFSFWNVFDFTLTGIAIYDIARQRVLARSGEKAAVLSAKGLSAKGLRMFKLVRILRLLRVTKSVPELGMVVEGLISSVKSIVWVLLLLLILIYMFAVIFTTLLSSNDYEDEFEGIAYFSDMVHSMLTLLDIAILSEWGEVVRPISEKQMYVVPLFLVFLLLSAFGMANAVIGVIVDSTARAKKNIEDQITNDQIKQASDIWRSRIHARGLSAVDIANAPESDREMKEQERDAEITAILQQLLDNPDLIPFPKGLHPEDVINLLDFDASGNLTHVEFVIGLERLLLGEPFQLTCLTLTVLGKLRAERASHEKHVNARLEVMQQQIGTIMDKLQINTTSRDKDAAR